MTDKKSKNSQPAICYMDPKMDMKSTNWKYKNLPIYEDREGKFYIQLMGVVYPINYTPPKTIQMDKKHGIDQRCIVFHGNIGVDQDDSSFMGD